jgi:DNA-binding response OmpR family regulator
MVFFELVELKGAVEWKVRDSGPGIPAAQRETIFDRFFTTGEGNGTIRSGSGIGLALCKKMTELHQGIIYCNKEPSKGAEFLVKIPTGRDHFMDIHLADDSPVNDDVHVLEIDENPKRLHAVFEDTIKPGRKDAILLVEDNKELLAYLTDKFKDNYEVYTASNGLAGIALAQKHLPDLIIADIMMEKMSGLDLCQQIKSQLETSHIPIILLTAKSSKSSILQGLQLKADDYVVKPFDPDELILKVGNLLESRRLFRSRIVKTLNLDPEKLNLTSLDDAFIDKAMRILEVNIGNTEFSVEDFAREMMVSRQILFTRIKALTSLTPNNLIKMVRLKRAHQILMAGSFTIAEVSRKVGFKDPRYFTKCFVRQYKALPSEVENSNFTDFEP